MIKSDYKNSSNNNIFSSSRRKSPIPVRVMVAIAILLAIWGIAKSINPSSQEPTFEEKQAIELNPQTLEDKNTTESLSADQSRIKDEQNKHELKLDFKHQTIESDREETKSNTNKKAEPSKSSIKISNQSDIDNRIQWHKTKIRSGDSMARIFKRLGFSPTDLHQIISIGSQTEVLKKVKPGKYIEYAQSDTGNLSNLKYHLDSLTTLIVNKSGDKWLANTDKKVVEIRTTSATGTIDSSLFLAGKKAGLTDTLVMELAGIFGWDIDFILDIRKNDQFTVIYEEKYVEGEKIGNGNILAAEFINQNKSYKAVRYTDKQGRTEYFTPDGYSMRKAFLRAPVDFSYISSSFNPRRFHPILKRVKAHNGVDYRAPRGTPVKAAGDGKVIRSAYNKYNGHYVFIQHGQKFVTKYLHFTKRKVRRGQKVKQGQIIGYVGSTGLAEAPHLHYEFLVNGVHRNPRTVKLPDAKPIAKSERKAFLKQTQSLVTQLDRQIKVYSDKFVAAD